MSSYFSLPLLENPPNPPSKQMNKHARLLSHTIRSYLYTPGYSHLDACIPSSYSLKILASRLLTLFNIIPVDRVNIKTIKEQTLTPGN